MLSAVRNSILKSSVMNTFVPRRAPRAKVRTVLRDAKQTDKPLAILAEEQQAGGAMLVDTDTNNEERVEPPLDAGSPKENRARGKRRRKA